MDDAVMDDAVMDDAFMDDAVLGLRERKKRRTRQALAEAALDLFRERGFEGTTVADIAAAAEVSPRTFFSYFPSKEDVLLGESEDRFDLLRTAIAERASGEPIIRAIQRVLPVMLEQALGRPHERVQARAKVILANPAILDRLRQRFSDWEEMLTAALMAEAGGRDELEARVVAAAVIGATRAFVEVMMHSNLDDEPEVVRARSAHLMTRAFGLLERGLGSYG
jgi:AcrR family transcriptional regulator